MTTMDNAIAAIAYPIRTIDRIMDSMSLTSSRNYGWVEVG
jgi:hypothetical protein